NVNNLVPEENKAPVLNDNVTETNVTYPQEPEAITEVKNEQQTEPDPNGESKPADKPRFSNKRERPKGDTIYSDARSIAVKILTRVERTDSYLDKLIDYEIRTELLNEYDKSLLNEICHGVIRWMRRLDWFLNGFYRGNWEKCTPEIKNTLRVALYQILFLNKIPDFAAVNEAVEFVKRISTQKHADVVNGLLRTIIRTKNELVLPTREIDEVKYLGIMQSHPNWMVKKWIERFGFEEAEQLAESNNKRPILTLRLNTLKLPKAEILNRFNEKNIVYRTCRNIDYFITLRLMSKIYLDEDFKNGLYAVQDESAGLAAVLLNPNENDMILDMCAAPGGKSTHIAQLIGNKGRIYSVDKYEAKINIMKQNAQRLGVTNIEFIKDDAQDLQDERIKDLKFNKILLDAPCSGLGVLSKKPEIRWKREPEDITALTEIQKNLLNSAVKYLNPGGVIVYSTCTTEKEENMDVVNDFLEKNPDFKIDNANKFVKAELVNSDGCIETFPHKHNIDGSFAARLMRK
ncbi:MAG: 16S rRNA (cytosine(967)-C(5))-methyltransferase RsmB, partial [Ignavibacteria bacterium]|nr:16S rRNA (cytosine(967)-C(5))-methyltransferase RsmB [Ignavibacteria bacterium]